MKRILLITILVVGLTATYGFAQMGQGMMGSGQGMMGGGQGMMGSGQGMMGGQSQQQSGGSDYYPCEQMMGGYGMMGSGHMGGMMGQGRMGGYGMMGQGHMGGMMGPGMMRGYGYRGSDPEAYKQYLDDTAGLRRKLHNKRFEYSEAVRNPDTTRKSLLRLEKEMMDLRWKIYEKAPGE